jgi:predicted Fe-Mo cluster-binding NifX family protein
LARSWFASVQKEADRETRCDVEALHPNSPIDPHVGRARYCLVVDTSSGDFVIGSSTAPQRSLHTAGIQSVGTLMGAEVVTSGHIGPKASSSQER